MPYSLAVANGRLYAGGNITAVNGQAIRRLAAFDPNTGAAVAGWRPRADNTVESVVPVGRRIYVGGKFGSINGVSGTRRLAAVTTAGTVDTGFTSRAGEVVHAIAVGASGIYAAHGRSGRPTRRVHHLGRRTLDADHGRRRAGGRGARQGRLHRRPLRQRVQVGPDRRQGLVHRRQHAPHQAGRRERGRRRLAALGRRRQRVAAGCTRWPPTASCTRWSRAGRSPRSAAPPVPGWRSSADGPAALGRVGTGSRGVPMTQEAMPPAGAPRTPPSGLFPSARTRPTYREPHAVRGGAVAAGAGAGAVWLLAFGVVDSTVRGYAYWTLLAGGIGLAGGVAAGQDR